MTFSTTGEGVYKGVFAFTGNVNMVARPKSNTMLKRRTPCLNPPVLSSRISFTKEIGLSLNSHFASNHFSL